MTMTSHYMLEADDDGWNSNLSFETTESTIHNPGRSIKRAYYTEQHPEVQRSFGKKWRLEQTFKWSGHRNPVRVSVFWLIFT